MQAKKTVLAFSGGLDTSYCVKYLTQTLGHEVHAVTVNTGGFDPKEQKELEEKALMLGATSYAFLDKTEEYYLKGVRYLLYGNVLKNNTYPLSVSAERVFQALAIARHANELGADAIAHGSTGAGNDQVRFDMVFLSLCPGVEIITPIRDQSLSRKEEVDFLIAHGVELEWAKAQYSINKGLWGTSVGGKETLTSVESLPESAYPSQLEKGESQTIEIGFEKGEPVSLNGRKDTPVALIEALNKLGGQYAIGRDTHVGDTIIGIKGRVGFEAPAAHILIKAHHLLEKHVQTKHQLFIKSGLSEWYGQLMHEGQYLDPVMRDIEAFLTASQQYVSGTVKVELAPYRCSILGVASDHDLMQATGSQYGEANKGWTNEDARGFAKLFANQSSIFHHLHN